MSNRNQEEWVSGKKDDGYLDSGSSSTNGEMWIYSLGTTRRGTSLGKRAIKSIQCETTAKSYMETEPGQWVGQPIHKGHENITEKTEEKSAKTHLRASAVYCWKDHLLGVGTRAGVILPKEHSQVKMANLQLTAGFCFAKRNIQIWGQELNSSRQQGKDEAAISRSLSPKQPLSRSF